MMDKKMANAPATASSGSKGRMTSTWHLAPRSEWNFFHKTLVHMGAQAVADRPDESWVTQQQEKEDDEATVEASLSSDQDHGTRPSLVDSASAAACSSRTSVQSDPPVYEYTDPVPVYSVWSQHRWVLPRAMAPLLANIAFAHLTGTALPRWLAAALYLVYLLSYGGQLFRHLQRMTRAYGCFDGHKARDGIPDVEVSKVTLGLLAVIVLRTTFAFYLLFPDTVQGQKEMISWTWAAWLPLNCFLYSCAIDFWFYWYHRLMHEVPFLWQFHRKHHTTKHPIAALGSFADHEQELFDMLLIPLLAYRVWPIDFPTWVVSVMYTLYIEAAGHSGLRAVFSNPTTSPYLQWIGCDLVIEDHDLHHRKGWKRATNYGKQTRIWDTLFGTRGQRIEGVQGNVDWSRELKLL